MKKKINCPTCGGFGFVTKFSDYSVWSEQCNGTGEIEAPFTIGDRIRSMSDEDMPSLHDLIKEMYKYKEMYGM